MSGYIKINYSASPKDWDTLLYFYKNIDAFIEQKAAILEDTRFYDAFIYGMGIGGLFVGERDVSIGEALRLYETSWKIEEDGDVLYLIHMSGSPLSGGNQCTMWSVKKQDFISYSYKSFSIARWPAHELKRPVFKKTNGKENDTLLKLFSPIILGIKTFEYKYQKEQDKLAFQDKIKRQREIKTDKNGVTSVMRYCETDNLKQMTRIWLNDKQAFDAISNDGRTMINFGARHLNALKFLIKKGKTDFTLSPIADACEMKENVKERLNLLLELGADINGKNYLNETPLEVAKTTLNEPAIEWLKEHGAI